MPDITMCLNDGCPLRNDCYRFMAEPNEYRQSYARFECSEKAEHFLEMIKPVCGVSPCQCSTNTWEYGDEDCQDCPFHGECEKSPEKPERSPKKLS